MDDDPIPSLIESLKHELSDLKLHKYAGSDEVRILSDRLVDIVDTIIRLFEEMERRSDSPQGS
jgi:hypothetical protein